MGEILNACCICIRFEQHLATNHVEINAEQQQQMLLQQQQPKTTRIVIQNTGGGRVQLLQQPQQQQPVLQQQHQQPIHTFRLDGDRLVQIGAADTASSEQVGTLNIF